MQRYRVILGKVGSTFVNAVDQMQALERGRTAFLAKGFRDERLATLEAFMASGAVAKVDVRY